MKTFDEFKNNINIIEGDEAHILRQKYIDSFVDKETIYFSEYIDNKTLYSDGWYYNGYIWDTVKDFNVADISNISSLKLDKVYILWDLHSIDRIRIVNYWKFPKESVIHTRYKDALEHLSYFPMDIYIFDHSYTWSIILTHEVNENNAQYILTRGIQQD